MAVNHLASNPLPHELGISRSIRISISNGIEGTQWTIVPEVLVFRHVSVVVVAVVLGVAVVAMDISGYSGRGLNCGCKNGGCSRNNS